jgi:hypothetical protein
MPRNAPDPDETSIFETSEPAAAAAAPAAETPISVEIILRIGTETRTVNALAATDADPYKVARGLLSGLSEDTSSWLFDRQS